ncbi:MAG TPA: hypothetical protein VM238_20600 [Phycisphaerae bacterium]|nr:hypothetical protein [Phycisphaerae bacterium]
MVRATLLVHAALIVWALPHCGTAVAAETDDSTLDTWRISDAAMTVLKEDGGGMERHVLFPRKEEGPRPTEDIALNLRKQAAEWVGKALKKDYVPRDLATRFIGCRRTLKTKHITREIDYLFVRFRIHNVMIHVGEQELGLCVMLRPVDGLGTRPPATWDKAHRYLLDVFTAFFRQPNVDLDHTELRLLCRNGSGEHPVFLGRMRLAPYPGIPGADPFKQKRYWYDDMSVLVDGNTVAFFFRKFDGTSEGASAPVAGKRW